MDESKVIFLKKFTFISGLFIGIFFLYTITDPKNLEIKFEELALGENITSHYGKVEKKTVHCADEYDIHICLDDYSKFGKNKPVTLWLGNSQINAIEQFTKDQKTATMRLHKLASNHNQYVISISQPNANLQEHFLLTSFLISKIPIKYIILPVVLDDTREDGLRYTLRYLLNDNQTKIIIDQYSTGKNLLKNYESEVGTDNLNLKNNIKNYQEKSENYLNSKLENSWFLWSERGNLRGKLYIKLYKLRNFIFKINPSSTRKILPGLYLKNFQALDSIIKLAQENKIKILMYNVPIRNDVKIPYKIDDYSKFKSDLDYLSKKYLFKYINLENIVPNNLWAEKTSTTLSNETEIDFMHFKEKGHEILAENIYFEIKKFWKDAN